MSAFGVIADIALKERQGFKPRKKDAMENAMMQNMTNMMPAMGWTMGAIWLLVVTILILGVVALLKYVFSE